MVKEASSAELLTATSVTVRTQDGTQQYNRRGMYHGRTAQKRIEMKCTTIQRNFNGATVDGMANLRATQFPRPWRILERSGEGNNTIVFRICVIVRLQNK
jgi:hypothetical protein